MFSPIKKCSSFSSALGFVGNPQVGNPQDFNPLDCVFCRCCCFSLLCRQQTTTRFAARHYNTRPRRRLSLTLQPTPSHTHSRIMEELQFDEPRTVLFAGKNPTQESPAFSPPPPPPFCQTFVVVFCLKPGPLSLVILALFVFPAQL